MFTSKVWTDDSKLLQESNLTVRQPCRAPHHVIQATMSEGLAQGPYMVAKVGFEPATLQTQGTELTTEPPCPTCSERRKLFHQNNFLSHNSWSYVTDYSRSIFHPRPRTVVTKSHKNHPLESKWCHCLNCLIGNFLLKDSKWHELSRTMK